MNMLNRNGSRPEPCGQLFNSGTQELRSFEIVTFLTYYLNNYTYICLHYY